MDSTRDYGYYGDADLSQYLQRPVRVLDQDWTVTAGTFNATLNPWTLFIEDTNVRKRVEGYRLLQGTLNIRIAINGGPFFYGRAIAAYEPRHTDNQHSFGANNGEYLIQQLSMLPHVFLDPTSSEGGEIVCPFLCPDNWIDLIGGTYKDMGQLRISSINDLLHANSSSGTVNVSVYVWMTNVRLAAPTTNTYSTYEAHCGEIVETDYSDYDAHAGDEYGTGIISKPASSVAKVMGMLSNIPAIKPYARPSELVASAIGRAAHMFGFSRPAIISDIQRVKVKAAGNLANTDQHDAVIKLTLDSKQELTVDPRTVGLSDVDELAFNYIKQKECYVSTIEWTESQSGDTALGTLAIGPDYHNQETINGELLNCLAPLYTVAAPFNFWKGSIKVRFQIVASQLHRGRLRFSYDPFFHLNNASPGENQTYSRIVDLATNRDFEMVISWNHAKAWLRVLNRLATSVYSHPAGTVSVSDEYHNGQVRVEVVNELTSPDPALEQPVYINIFVSAGEDFEVAGPTDSMLSVCQYEPQSGTEGEELIAESDNIPESPAPIAPIGVQESPDNPNTHIFFGESFASVRALLKRYVYHQCYRLLNDADGGYVIESNFPVEPGQSVAPRHTTAAGATPDNVPYNYTTMTYLNWFVPCYAAWRGGLRSKWIHSKNQSQLYIRRISEPVSQADCGINGYSHPSDLDSLNYALVGLMKGLAGSDWCQSNVDGALEVEFPFYSHKRFAPARKFLDGSQTDGEEWTGENAGHILYAFGSTSQQTMLYRFVAAGDDFSCFMWMGQPGVKVLSMIPAPDGTGSPTLPAY